MAFGGTAANIRRQRLWERYLDDTATIQRPTQVVSATGGRTLTWGTVATVAGRWQPVRWQSSEAPTAGAVLAVGAMLIMVPAGTDVQETDRIQRGADSSLWEVKGTSGPRSFEYGLAVEAVQVSA